MKLPLASIAIALACYRPEGSPLVGAARTGDVAAIRALAARGADVNAPEGVNDWTPLLHAVHKNQIGSVQALLDAGADPNRANSEGRTPLMMAAGYGYTNIVKLLLRRGADPRLRDGHGKMAIDYAAGGVADIDRFTIFHDQSETVNALRGATTTTKP